MSVTIEGTKFSAVAELCQEHFGYTPTRVTVSRWVHGKGRAGRTLKSIRVGKNTMTTLPWFLEFSMNDCDSTANPQSKAKKSRSPAARAKAIELAKRELERR